MLESPVLDQPIRDILRLPALDALGGSYQTWIRATGGARADVDRTGLVVVDHDPGLRALPVDGRIILGTFQPAWRVVTDDGADVTAKLSTGGSGPVVVAPGGSLTIDFTSKGDDGFLVVSASRDGSSGPAAESGVVVQVPDGAGWRKIAQLYPRRGTDDLGVDIGAATRVRMSFVSDVHVTAVGRLTGTSAPSTWATLQTAAKSTGGDLTSALNDADGTGVTIAGQDSINLTFQAPDAVKGTMRDCFLWVDAVVRGARAASELSQQARLEIPAPRFALYPAWPNPFTQRIVVRFALVVPRSSRLEVFDLQGRRLRTLCEGALAAGDHAVEWDGRDDAGQQLGRGTYFLRLAAGSFQQQRKITLAR